MTSINNCLMNDSVIVQPSKRYKLLNEILINMTLIDKIVT